MISKDVIFRRKNLLIPMNISFEDTKKETKDGMEKHPLRRVVFLEERELSLIFLSFPIQSSQSGGKALHSPMTRKTQPSFTFSYIWRERMDMCFEGCLSKHSESCRTFNHGNGLGGRIFFCEGSFIEF